jgi:hypothetical protein
MTTKEKFYVWLKNGEMLITANFHPSEYQTSIANDSCQADSYLEIGEFDTADAAIQFVKDIRTAQN